MPFPTKEKKKTEPEFSVIAEAIYYDTILTDVLFGTVIMRKKEQKGWLSLCNNGTLKIQFFFYLWKFC